MEEVLLMGREVILTRRESLPADIRRLCVKSFWRRKRDVFINKFRRRRKKSNNARYEDIQSLILTSRAKSEQRSLVLLRVVQRKFLLGMLLHPVCCFI